MKKKKVKAPEYEQLADTAYISGLREDLPTYRNMYNEMLPQLDVTSPEVQQKFDDISAQAVADRWNSFNREALSGYKAMNQANRNRFGNLGSSGAMYGADTYSRQLNNLASAIASDEARYNQALRDSYYNQKFNTLNAYGSAYGGAGSTLQNNDIANWKIRNQNIDAKYAADAQNANRGGFNFSNALSGAASGATTGAMSGGGWIGGIIGGVGGALAGGFSDSGDQASRLGSSIGSIYPSARSGSTTNNINLNTQGGNLFTTSSNGYNPWRLNTRY